MPHGVSSGQNLHFVCPTWSWYRFQEFCVPPHLAQLEPEPYLPAGHSKQGTFVLGRNLPRGQLHGVGAGTGPELEHVPVFATAAHAVSEGETGRSRAG